MTTEDYENCRQTLINACKANSKLFENNEWNKSKNQWESFLFFASYDIFFFGECL